MVRFPARPLPLRLEDLHITPGPGVVNISGMLGIGAGGELRGRACSGKSTQSIAGWFIAVSWVQQHPLEKIMFDRTGFHIYSPHKHARNIQQLHIHLKLRDPQEVLSSQWPTPCPPWASRWKLTGCPALGKGRARHSLVELDAGPYIGRIFRNQHPPDICGGSHHLWEINWGAGWVPMISLR